MIDKSFLTKGCSDKKNGRYAEPYPSGQPKHFGFYKNGNRDSWWASKLSEGEEEGSAIHQNGSGGSADLEHYINGTAERFDA